ncbi:polysaccharide lyase family 8 super-sandwich domain-containing protein [Pedobacter nyackensis]|uniref:polysaccharide lyase family 8 super-sandwich domain-containing protein n=1 Tax=Pedobacter nyackensis TaxID=475255 RepID=UPI00292CC279|nr:polysaccharide lyase family 8 super-sandwich domain-containing protein [Pedobacter nyackensis]
MNIISKHIILAFGIATISYASYAQRSERGLAFENYNKYQSRALKVKDATKEAAIEKYRQEYTRNGYRRDHLRTKLTWQDCLNGLNEDGQFSDLIRKEEEYLAKDAFAKGNHETQQEIGVFLTEASQRIWRIADAVRSKGLTASEALSDKYCKAILHYGGLEVGRMNNSSRFHASCFAIPTAAVNIYFVFLPQINDVETGVHHNKQLKDVAEMLKALALQSWTQPLRQDSTDDNVVQIERFRKHVWWVGGNALAYRPLLPTAVMYKSIPMIDVLSEVSQKSISAVSQNTYDQAFWNEGFTVDGAGWGHGKQSLVWGYPIDGMNSALSMLSNLKGSPWARKLSAENAASLMNFFRGGNWYYYKGYIPLCTDRYTAVYYNQERKKIKYSSLINQIASDWMDSFSAADQKELLKLKAELTGNDINMEGYPSGQYSGTRWFFNNDDLIKRNKNYYININMASNRCDGLEGAVNFADEYNFFNADGLSFFMKKGDEYHKIIGAWDITASPGVTSRRGMDAITPLTNWRGYCSKHNFAGAATNGGENAVAGFIFEKMNASDKEGVNDKGNQKQVKNETIYGVKAFKSYFMYGDYMVALGAGVSNLNPSLNGDIHTTIDQTSVDNEANLMVVKDGKSQSMDLKNGPLSFFAKDKTVWMQQKSGFAYTVLPEYVKNAYFTYEKDVKNEWIKRNQSNQANISKLPATTNILRLWIDHGKSPLNDVYGYVVFAGDKMPAGKLPFHVLRNDTTVQAIQSVDKKVVEAVFYTPGLLKAKGLDLSVSACAVVMIEDKGHIYQVTVNDPLMNPALRKIKLTLNSKSVEVDMPVQEYGGRPVTLTFKK